jgi:hypothetical protein
MEDIRSSFDEAIEIFRDHLVSQGWSPDILWLSRERITGHKRSIWIYRPEELISDKASRDFYNSILKTDGSIRIDGLVQIGSKTLGYVENYGGDSKLLNLGTHQSEFDLHVVASPSYWRIIELINRVRGISPFLKHMKITGQNQSIEAIVTTPVD